MKRFGVRLLVSLGVTGCATAAPRKAFEVTVDVDFGPAGKAPVHQVVQVKPGATPQDATAQALPVQKGAVCCDPRETAGIDGVAADPGSNKWWTISINGSKKGVNPYKTKLKPGDVVRWEYRQYDQ